MFRLAKATRGGRPALACLLAVAVGGCAAGSRSESPPPGEPQRPRAGEAPKRENPAESGGWLGVVLARHSLDLTTDSVGKIKAVLAAVGDPVEAGRTVVVLDDEQLRQDLLAAQAALRAAQDTVTQRGAELAAAEGQYERRQALHEIVSQQEIQAAELEKQRAAAGMDIAKAQVEEQQARVARLQLELGKTRIEAPFSGTLAARFRAPGEVVGPGAPIVRLISSGDLILRFAVPPQESPAVRSEPRVSAIVQGSETAVDAVIEHVAPEIDPASGMLLVQAGIDRAAAQRGGLQAGLEARVFPFRRAGPPHQGSTRLPASDSPGRLEREDRGDAIRLAKAQ